MMKNQFNASAAVALEPMVAHTEGESINTELTTLQLYPHTETRFHYMMGFWTFFFFLPLSCLLLPVFILVKLVLYTPLCFLFSERVASTALGQAITRIKNNVLMLFHYCVFKVHYTHATIWMACFHKQDDHWYGVDMAPYRDYQDYITSFRDSRVRWRYKKKLKTFQEWAITEKVLPDHLVFFKILFSRGIFSLIKESSRRKNDVTNFSRLAILMSRDYILLLFLPLRVHVFEKDGRVVGLCSYLKKGNVFIMCQHIIADDVNRSGLYYQQMDRCFSYAFGDPDIHYVSCGFTSGQSKQTSGCQPINFLLTDEFKLMPFKAFSEGQTA